MYFEACALDWAAIHEAQEIIVEKMTAAQQLTVIANQEDPDPYRRTHLLMSLVGGSPANSVVGRNIPGAEVFEAPEINSADGTFFARGPRVYGDQVMSDIFLRLENGRIVEARARENQAGLLRLLDADDQVEGYGSRYLGEVAIGTNNVLASWMNRLGRDSLRNILLLEKMAFHIAIGNCYTDTMYDGKPVQLNNGNTSKYTSLHFDLPLLMNRTTMRGRILLDGELLQEDGYFVDPRLRMLNPR